MGLLPRRLMGQGHLGVTRSTPIQGLHGLIMTRKRYNRSGNFYGRDVVDVALTNSISDRIQPIWKSQSTSIMASI